MRSVGIVLAPAVLVIVVAGLAVRAKSADEGGKAGAGADATALSKLMEEGDPIAQRTCKACHGMQGEGAVGPPLRQNVSDARGVVKAIIEGRGEMPPFAAKFSDREIAAVVTYVRNSWGNSYGVVTEEQVAQIRR